MATISKIAKVAISVVAKNAITTSFPDFMYKNR